jgi:hypothetical protein
MFQNSSTAAEAERGQCTNLISTYGEENEKERKRDGTDASISEREEREEKIIKFNHNFHVIIA